MGKTETNGLERLNLRLKRIQTARAFLKLADNKTIRKSFLQLLYHSHGGKCKKNQLTMEDHKEIY